MTTFCAPMIGGPRDGKILRTSIADEHYVIPYDSGKMQEYVIDGIVVRLPDISFHVYNLDHRRRAWIYEEEKSSKA